MLVMREAVEMLFGSPSEKEPREDTWNWQVQLTRVVRLRQFQ